MKTNKKESNEAEENFFASIGKIISRNWHIILIALIAFLASTAILYFDASTTETIASFSLTEYEIGQIADKTIYATKSLPADGNFPVEIEEGEKIIKKG